MVFPWCFPATFPVELPEQWWQKVLETSSASTWYNFSPGKVWGSWLACSFLRSGWKSGAWEALSTEPAGTAGESPMSQGHSKGFHWACIARHGLRALGHTLCHFLANLLWNHTCHNSMQQKVIPVEWMMNDHWFVIPFGASQLCFLLSP